MISKKAISLFSSAGVGELGIKKNNIDIILSNELLAERHEIHKTNYPNCFHITGDIWDKKSEIIHKTNELLRGEQLFLVYATPPCQGMSSTGAGKILSEIKKGNRSILDERNRLIIPTLDIIEQLKPEWVIFENVEHMKNTIIQDENNNYVSILEYIHLRLGKEYFGSAEIVNCSDYGIPQSRKRLITIFTKNTYGKEYFHFNTLFFLENEKLTSQKKVTLRDAIGHLPPIDSKKGNINGIYEIHPHYMVPVLNEDRYTWVINTKEGDSAFNNQCINPRCMFGSNKRHGSNVKNGIHSSNNNTPLYCEKCDSLLPRPAVIDKNTGNKRIIKGYDTTFARMEWDKPAPTLTQNFQYDSSGRHYHPEQNRVLSIYEGLILQTISEYDYLFEIYGTIVSRKKIAEIIGESIPPKLVDFICRKIIKISKVSEIN